jgi:prepilin-type N-terminal cleavage/methylation domain-containing protein
MAAREVIRRRGGFTLLEVMVTVAIAGILVALAANALSESRRVSRVSGQARLLVQRLQTVRTNAVSQGNAQGYAIGPNGIAVGGPNAHQCFIFIKQNPLASPVNFDAVNDIRDPNGVDELPRVDTNTLVTIKGASGLQPGPFQIGFDINGQATVNPAGPFPYCIQVSDPYAPAIQRWVILFNDGTVKVQNNDSAGAYCP